MGRKIRWREARRREAALRLDAVLEANARTDARRCAPFLFLGLKPEYRDRVEALRGYALRAPEDWRCRIKSRDENRRFIDLVGTLASARPSDRMHAPWG